MKACFENDTSFHPFRGGGCSTRPISKHVRNWNEGNRTLRTVTRSCERGVSFVSGPCNLTRSILPSVLWWNTKSLPLNLRGGSNVT